MSKRTLSHRIEAIEYVHAADGRPYRHDFTRGDTDISLGKRGTVTLRNRSGKKLWDEFNVDGRRQAFLINPRGTKESPTRRQRTMAKKRKATRRRRRNPRTMSAAQARYFAPRRRNKPRARARRRRRASNPVAVVSYRRRRSSNPLGFSLNGLLGKAMQGAQDGLCVAAGKLGVRFASSQFDYPEGSMWDSLIELAAAMGIGIVAPRFVGQDRTRFLVAGGFDSVIETFIAQANIPKVSNLLGATPIGTSATYPPADASSLRNLVLSRLNGYTGAGGKKKATLSIGTQFAGYPQPMALPAAMQ